MNIFKYSPVYHDEFNNLSDYTNYDSNKIGIMFSGGLDSAYLLKWFLINTPHEICVFHHIRRAWDELYVQEPAKKLIDVFRNKYRSFNYYEIKKSENLINGQLTLGLSTAVSRPFQFYLGILPNLFGMGIPKIYYGISLDDIDLTSKEKYPGKLYNEVVDFWKIDVMDQLLAKSKMFDFFGNLNAFDYWQNFADGIGEVFKTTYKLNWYPVLSKTPSEIMVSRQNQFEFLYENGKDEDIIKGLLINCRHTPENAQQLASAGHLCRCHIHYYNLYMLDPTLVSL